MKNSKNLYAFLLAALSCVGIAGCSTLPPAREDKALVIGKVEFRASGYETLYGIDINGVTNSGLTLTVSSLDQASSFDFKPGPSGCFATSLLTPGTYRIKRIEYKENDTNTGSWRNVYADLPSNVTFSVTSGAVNNLGYFVWVSDGRTNRCEYYANSGYDVVRSQYGDAMVKSGWDSFPSAEIQIPALNAW